MSTVAPFCCRMTYIPLNAEPSEYWLVMVIEEPDVCCCDDDDCGVVLYTAVRVTVPLLPTVAAWSLVVVPSDQWLK